MRLPRLEYPNFECIVIINNTPDPALWLPIEEHCKTLGERFKFLRADNIQGFKAGALRLAQAHTAADAEIIGVIVDPDYVVQADWLKDLVPAFGDATVGLIQAPQDHRDGERSVMHHAMNGEYAGFFDIGMVQRNEHNALSCTARCADPPGRARLVRRLVERTICEDTDLGLTMLEHGWQAHYTNKRYGHGLLPDSFEAYKKQRHRWAYGGFQILKKHWRRFLPGASRLTARPEARFAMGWLNWLGAESLGVVVALMNIVWVPVVAFLDIAVPDRILTVPIIASFAVSVLHFFTLYRLRVRIPKGQLLGAVFAAMSVQWTVARAVGFGLIKEHLPFVRTSKGGLRRSSDFHAFWESVLGAC